ncbi:bacteriophage spanin2 family protein [Actinosynnema sp. NPDC023587]|uniref:bacteriophage spanin2 family protein n=1 Tax=Actinosynnema sp. NPDC023587 TaxID=3154695 RepID=UPI0033CFDE03
MRSPVALALSAVTLAVVVSGCGAAQEVADTANAISNTATTVQVCTDALSQAGRIFDGGSPERTVDSAHAAAGSLADLAASAADTTVNQAISALAATLRDVTVDDVIGRPAAWLAAKADQVAALTSACAP